MNRDQEIYFSVTTPGGLIVRIELDNAPQTVRDMFRKVEEPESIMSEKVVAFLSRLTGCPCTVHRIIQVSCGASWGVVNAT